MVNLRLGCLVLAIACLCLISGEVCADEYRTITDMRGNEVQIPIDIERVVIIDDGLIEGVMFVLGEEEKIVGVGSSWSCIQWVHNYSYQTVDGETHEVRDGMNTVTYLCPWIRDLPLVAKSQPGVNYEMLAGLDPDLVILRVGDCVLPSMEDEGVQKTIQTIEALGIPAVVLRSHRDLDEPEISMISDEIRIIGQVFGKEDEAVELADYLESEVEFVEERTKDIPDSEQPTVLIIGPSSSARKAGMAGIVRGTNEIRSYFIEEIVHAKNAFQEPGSPYISTEQLLALDPDVIIIAGGHPSDEFYSAPSFQNLGELSAVKNRRVYSHPWEPCDCSVRLVYPIGVMTIAKAAYPNLFADIKVHEWVLEFYQNVYGVDEETAIGLRSAQWLDWTVEEDF